MSFGGVQDTVPGTAWHSVMFGVTQANLPDE